MKAHLTQLEGMTFKVEAEGSPAIILDAEKRRSGPSPFEAALLAAMGCTASDIVWILKKEREPFTKLEIEAEAERADADPKVLKKVHLHYKIHGDGVKAPAVRRAIDLSEQKYCSVGIMLRRGGVRWESTYEILPST